jgi:hypothetical protein
MNHKEMSRRTLAVVFVWGFWLFWVTAGIACLTTHEIERHAIVRGYDGRYPKPEYTSAGLAVAALIWLSVSFFPMVLDRWKHGRVTVAGPLHAYIPTLSGIFCGIRRRYLIEFVLTLLAVALAPVLSDAGDMVYLSCLLVMAGLMYSCFRLRQVGLDYLEPLQRADEPDTEKRDEGISGDSILNARP